MRNGNPKSHHVVGRGSADSDLTDDELRAIVREALADVTRGANVLAIIPDKTRDDNTPVLFAAAAEILSERHVSKFDALVAQGTHGPMTAAEKFAKIGNAKNFNGTIFDHRWDDPESLVTIGELTRETVAEITGGLLDEPIKLTINRLLAPGAYDLVLIFGATVPHEVAGFAGGAKYFFPGVAGAELTHKTH